MRTLEALVVEARVLAGSTMEAIHPGRQPMTDDEAEVGRQMQICNACRYCEGYCAVFPAMTRRLEFAPADVHYLAHLCHNCGACYHACQYAPPHEFAVNVPRAMARVRVQSYADFAWPAAAGALYRRAGLTVALALAAGLALLLVLAVALGGLAPDASVGANFYAVYPHALLVGLFGSVFGFVVLALGIAVRRFWRTLPEGRASADAATDAAQAVLSMRYLGGGHGLGCNEADDRYTLARRRFHHLSFYGFMACLASTAVATLYHYLLDWHAPYALTSLPVLLGTLGGLGLVVGPAGLLWLNLKRDELAGDARQRPMDRGFIALLLLTSLTGLGLLAWRESPAMAWWLALHLGVVLALFVTLPYGKFAHGVHRSAALLRYAIERREADKLQLGAD
jgi:citrate/tricarballylate utilization protein